tara:strand:- start:1065 stop:1421 length:357 start_codon:yes stop_codon:yes gene_type:complete
MTTTETKTAIQSATAHFKDKLAGKLYKYHCDEWDIDIYYRSSSSMRVESKIMSLTQNGKAADALVESIILKALDQDGNRLFKETDRATLMNEADPQVIIKLASQLNNTDDTMETVTKN